MRWKMGALAAAFAVATLVPGTSHAVHWYRGPGGGCTPADGEINTDAGASGTVTATVAMLHNSFNDLASGGPITRIKVGEAVRWQWWSAHCQSAKQDGGFYSGFHYPKTPPEGPQVASFFEYPVFDITPTLSYVRTFTQPGTYSYFCEHHLPVGMVGVVVVE